MMHYRYIDGEKIDFPITPRDQTTDDTRKTVYLLSPLDFEIKVVDLPQNNRRDVRPFLELKLATLYPGSPDQTVFDFKTDGNNKVVVFITKKSVITDYKAATDQAPLFLPYSIVKKSMSKESVKTVCTFWWKDWLELFLFEREELKLSRAYSLDPAQNRGEFLMGKIPDEYSDAAHILFCHGSESDKLQNELSSTSPEPKRIILIEEAVRKVKRRADFVFSSQLPNNRNTVILGAVLLAVISLTAIIISRRNSSRMEYLDNLQGKIQNVEEVKEISDTVKIRESELSEIRARKPLDIYHFLRDISDALGDETDIQQLYIDEKGNFQIEGRGKESFSIITRLENARGFAEIKLPQTSQDPATSGERFTLMGVYYE